MPLINTADAVYVGDTAADRVYLGDALVWETATAVTGLIDDVGVAAYKAFSLRLLRSAYAGSAIKVRRSSDSTTLDVGFTTAGVLDTAALLSFAGSGSAFIDTWYDQSGNARDMAQPSATAQPRIVNAGVVELAGSKPTPLFDGTDDCMFSAVAGVYDLGAATTVLVAQVGGSGTMGIYSESGSGNDSRYYVYGQSTGQISIMIRDSTGSQFADAPKSATPGVPHAFSIVDTGTGITTGIDGATVPYVYSRAGKTVTLTRSTIGARRDPTGNPTAWWNGLIPELVCFSAALTTGQSATALASQKAYYGTP